MVVGRCVLSKCKLCHQAATLCDSHVLPEFLYKSLYDERHKFIGITGIGNKGKVPLQKGLREKLFCRQCEQLLNLKYEIPFQESWKKCSPGKSHFIDNDSFVTTFDYESFKLFHLSIFFRASVSSLPTFSLVNLGPHEDKIRQMLLESRAGKESEYPLFGFAVLEDGGGLCSKIITRPINARFEGAKIYGCLYGGVMWWIMVSSHVVKNFKRIALKENGSLVLTPENWKDIGVIHDAADALKRVSKK